MSHEKVSSVEHGTEYLANERTFLAWIRTSIAVLSLGFLVARFGLWLREMSGRFPQESTASRTGASLVMGVSLMVLGGVLALLAAWRYHVVNRSIAKGEVKPDLGLIVLITGSVTVLAAAMAAYMFATAGR